MGHCPRCRGLVGQAEREVVRRVCGLFLTVDQVQHLTVAYGGPADDLCRTCLVDAMAES